MAERISRRKLAAYAVDELERGKSLDQITRQLAGFLIDERRTREADLLVRSIEDELASRGTVVARISSARPVNQEMRGAIKRLLQASTLHLDETVDETLIGGVRIEAPGERLDATIKRKILALGQAKM